MVPLWNHFSLPRTGAVYVETGSKLGTGPKMALNLPWWQKRGIIDCVHCVRQAKKEYKSPV